MITSTSNSKVKTLIQLQKKSKIREREGVFVAEGIRLVSEMKKEDLIGVYVSESWWRTHQRLADEMEPAPEILSDCVFAHVSDTKTPQGILGVVRRRVYGFADVTGETRKKQAHIVILSNLQDPGNVGTIFRTAEAAGVTGII